MNLGIGSIIFVLASSAGLPEEQPLPPPATPVAVISKADKQDNADKQDKARPAAESRQQVLADRARRAEAGPER
jgi:hypothetical protein